MRMTPLLVPSSRGYGTGTSPLLKPGKAFSGETNMSGHPENL